MYMEKKREKGITTNKLFSFIFSYMQYNYQLLFHCLLMPFFKQCSFISEIHMKKKKIYLVIMIE